MKKILIGFNISEIHMPEGKIEEVGDGKTKNNYILNREIKFEDI